MHLQKMKALSRMRKTFRRGRSYRRKTRRGGAKNYPPLPASPRPGNNNNNNNRSNMSNNNNNNTRSNMNNSNSNNNNSNSNYSNNNNSNNSNNGSNSNSNNGPKRRYRTQQENTNLAMKLLFGKGRR